MTKKEFLPFKTSRFMRVCLMLGLIAVLASGLSACGRKGDLEKPDGSTYPKEYPTN